ncbi:siderophore-iron reductase FhuF [Methylobacterium sp. J-078]|uniref:siderophore-iron reductase FhuF n=1 Tax=Methylobacterium sp. J-078 TaxID=2836657 RepID=UPI001FB8CACE|nr:siderophore-iron reductase FhuF [Methylobacterium sp. J-078]MCJ2046436.1 siderophore-iron reductase FhuF [Methylobacterium sp. J-078]
MMPDVMIAEVAARVPDSLGAYRGSVAVGPGGPGARSLTALRDPAAFDATLAAFGAGFGVVDRRILVSYWSQFYFAALATPALTALVCLGRALPLAFETTSLELDDAGRPARLLVAADAAQAPCGVAPGLGGLVAAHLAPFVALCHGQCGLAPRVLWGNAAVILDHVAGELGAGKLGMELGRDAPACAEIAACLGRGAPPCGPGVMPLARALCPGAGGCRRRRVCCLRSGLPGVPSCGALCPRECGAGAG